MKKLIRERREDKLALLVRIFAVCSVVLLVGSVFAVVSVSVEGGNDKLATSQIICGYIYDNATYGWRNYYVNASGVCGFISYSPPHAANHVFYGTGSTSLEYEDYNIAYGYPLTYYADNAGNLYATGEAFEWPAKDQWILIAINPVNATAGYTYTASTGTGIYGLPDFGITRIPTPTATLSNSNIDVTWPDWVINTTAPGPNQFLGYTVWRCEKTGSPSVATWNDNSTAGPVKQNVSEWKLVSGVAPISDTNWTDTNIELGKTYYYSLKLAFNGSCPVETMWGGLGSNPVTVTDTTPPIINHIPVISAYTDCPIWINATLTDPSGIEEAKLWYKDVGGNEHNVSMQEETGTDKYFYKIPGQSAPGKLYYYLWAIDNYDNAVRLPLTGSYEIQILSTVGNISGQVIVSISTSELGLHEATVTASNPNLGNFSAETDENGNYTIFNVPAGVYTVVAQKEGFTNDTRSSITVIPGQTTSHVDFALHPLEEETVPPFINIISPKNNTIVLNSKPTIAVEYSDEHGIYLPSVVLKINNKQVPVKPTKEGLSYTPEEPLEDGSYEVYLELMDHLGKLNSTSWLFKIITKGALAGKVIDIYGNPVEGVNITVVGKPELNNVTDQNGTYLITDSSIEYYIFPYRVLVGSYQLFATKSGYLPAGPESVSVAAAQVAYINFTLDVPRGDISGWVKDRNNNPILNALVKVESPFYSDYAYTNLSGYYEIKGIPGGIYNLTAEKEGYSSDIVIGKEVSIYKVVHANFTLEKLVAPPPEVSKPKFIPALSAVGASIALLGAVLICRRKKRN